MHFVISVFSSPSPFPSHLPPRSPLSSVRFDNNTTIKTIFIYRLMSVMFMNSSCVRGVLARERAETDVRNSCRLPGSVTNSTTSSYSREASFHSFQKTARVCPALTGPVPLTSFNAGDPPVIFEEAPTRSSLELALFSFLSVLAPTSSPPSLVILGSDVLSV